MVITVREGSPPTWGEAWYWSACKLASNKAQVRACKVIQQYLFRGNFEETKTSTVQQFGHWPSVLCDVTNAVAEFMVSPALSMNPIAHAFSVWTEFTVSTGKKVDAREEWH
jgi:hypothetical protein